MSFCAITRRQRRQPGIRLDISANLSEIPDVSDMDLCIIFGNLLENALEACNGMEDGAGHVEIQAEMRGKQLVLQIQNTYQRDVILKEGEVLLHKTQRSGGLVSPPWRRLWISIMELCGSALTA